MYHIDLVGADTLKKIGETPILNQGGLGLCEDVMLPVQRFEETSLDWYCEFESYFRRDLAATLMLRMANIHVLFVKPIGEDAVIVSFRFIPLTRHQMLENDWMMQNKRDLIAMVSHPVGRSFVLFWSNTYIPVI